MDRRTMLRGTGAAAVATGLATALPAAASAAPPPAGDLVLRYDEPAADWESQALPIGNGILGASIFGGVTTDEILLNEKTLWTGGPGSPGYDFGNWREPRPGAVSRVQQAIDERERLTPSEVAEVLGQPRVGYGSYQALGTLTLTTTPGAVSGYRRSLDLARGVAQVRYVDDGVQHVREYFASHPARVLVVRLSADRPGQISFRATLTPDPPTSIAASPPASAPVSPQQPSVPVAADKPSPTASLAEAAVLAAGDRITMSGALADNGLRFEAQLRVITIGGTRTAAADGSITVTGADQAILLVAAGTGYADRHPTYRGPDPHDRVTATVDRAAARPFPLSSPITCATTASSSGAYGWIWVNVSPTCPPTSSWPATGRARRAAPWKPSSSSTAATCSSRPPAPAPRCPPTSRASGIRTPPRRGAPTTTSTSTCR